MLSSYRCGELGRYGSVKVAAGSVAKIGVAVSAAAAVTCATK